MSVPFDLRQHPTATFWRSVRAGTFTVLAGQICVAGHVLGGGDVPDLALVVVLCAMLYPVMSGIARAQRGFGSWLAAMAVAQLVFHLALSLGAHASVGSDPQPWRMLAFHAIAAVVAASLLAAGDRLLFEIASWLRRLRPSAPVPLPAVGRLWTVVAAPASPTDDIRLLATPRRGPPVPTSTSS